MRYPSIRAGGPALAAALILSACATAPVPESLELRALRRSEATAAYEYVVNYPAFPAHPAATRLAAKIADDAIAAFVESARENRAAWEETSTPEELAAGRPPCELRLSWRAESLSPEAVSILFESYSYVGGAHGALALSCLNYDPHGRRLLGLADLLEGEGPDWLTSLAEAARAELTCRLDPAGDAEAARWIAAGTAPVPANYGCFTYGPDTLTIHFAPYQVAPWSAGPQDVLLPRDALALH